MQDYVRYMRTLDLEFVEVTELCKKWDSLFEFSRISIFSSEEQHLYGLDFSQACTNPPKVLLAAAVQGRISNFMIIEIFKFSRRYFFPNNIR